MIDGSVGRRSFLLGSASLVLGGCFDREFATWSNALVRDFRAHRLIPVLSDVTAAEVQDAPESVRNLHQELLTMVEAALPVTEEVLSLVRLEKIRLFNEANVQLGYRALSILSPREVTTYEGS